VAEVDGGSGECKALRPAYVDASFIAPVALRVVERGGVDVAQLVFNDSGVPRVVEVTAAAPDAGATADVARTKSTLPACAVAGDVTYCPDATGAVHAWRGDHHAIVAKSRAGTDVAGVAMKGHTVLAYVSERVTTEGVVREAYAVMDEGAPVRLSEGGSGATYVELAERGPALLAMTIDARVAMTPAHARPMSIEGAALKLSGDAVVFVGGSAERHNAGALSTSEDGRAFELVAVEDGATSFGMAAIRVDDPPREDEPVTWSMYPNGLDPAPIAATHGGPRRIVARVRPHDAAPKAQRVLEVGELGNDGAFASLCVVAQASFVKDVEVAEGRQGSLWIFYRDPRGSVLERRSLPVPLTGRR
jgi:hypothetical protein